MTNAESTLAILTCLVGVVCIVAVQNKKGTILGSVSSQLRGGTKKYIEQSKKRKSFYIYLSITFVTILLIALLFIRDLTGIIVFIGLNLASAIYFLSYFILLRPEDRLK